MSSAKRFLEIKNLHGWYGESHVLHGVNLHVDEGEVVTLLGRNGAGRTSTLRAIMGLIGRRAGSIQIRGVETVAMATHRIARLGLGNGSFYALLSLGLAVIFGLAQIAEDIVRDQFGVSGQQYPVPELLQGATNLGFMVLPNYRGFVIGASLLVCLSTWYIIERTRLGACLRAGTENPKLVQAFGINVPVILGAAAYATGWLIRSAGWSTEMGVLAGMGIGALLGLVVGLIAIRRQGIYFAMITLAMAQMIYFVCLQAPFTGGEDGLQGVPRGALFGGLIPLKSDVSLYYVVLAVFVAVFLAIIRIVHSPYGQVLKAIRENEPRAISLGYDVDKYKLLAFVLSTAIAGLAGSMKTLVLGFATLSDAHWSLSGEVVLMTLLGGMGTFAGPVVGAFTIIGLQDYLADRVGAWVTVIIGAIFVVCVLAFRKGFVGELIAWQQRRGKRAD